MGKYDDMQLKKDRIKRTKMSKVDFHGERFSAYEPLGIGGWG